MSLYCANDQQLTKKEPSSWGIHDGVLWWDSQDLHDTSQLFYLVLSRKQRVTRIQLCENTACTQTHLQLVKRTDTSHWECLCKCSHHKGTQNGLSYDYFAEVLWAGPESYTVCLETASVATLSVASPHTRTACHKNRLIVASQQSKHLTVLLQLYNLDKITNNYVTLSWSTIQ